MTMKIEKALANPDAGVRREAVYELGCMGGEEALTLLEKALVDPDDTVRRGAASALESVGGEEVQW